MRKITVSIISFIRTSLGYTDQLYNELQKYAIVKEIFAVTGKYDLALIMEAEKGEEIHDFFATNLDNMEGIIETNSHLIMKHKKIR